MIDAAGDSQVTLKWSKINPENYYLKIAILWADVASAVAAASLKDLKIQLRYNLSNLQNFYLLLDIAASYQSSHLLLHPLESSIYFIILFWKIVKIVVLYLIIFKYILV